MAQSNVVSIAEARPATNDAIMDRVTRDFQAHVAEHLAAVASKVRETQGKGKISFEMTLFYDKKEDAEKVTITGDVKLPKVTFTEELCEISQSGQITLFG